MKAKIFSLFIIAVIIFLGGYLRLANLGNNPSGLYVDEASTGVNANSILHTGKDEYGKISPLVFRFLGSYTPPLYTYLTSVSIFLNGYSIESIRLVSAISGILMIFVFFIFLKSLNIIGSKVLFLATSLFAITPWAIFYSRVGYETNLAFLLYSLGVLFLYLSIKKVKYFLLASLLLSLSTNAYHTERLLVHLTTIFFLITFRKEIFKKTNVWILISGFAVYILLLIPQILIFFTPANTSRGFGLFYSDAVISSAKQMSNLPIFLSAPIAFLREFLSQYLSYLSPRNLFFQPDSDLQRSLPELSVFYFWEFLFYLVGLFVLIKDWKKQAIKFTALLLILSPIPASLTGDPFSTQRALPLLLPIMILISLGIDKLLKRSFIPGIIIIFIFYIFSIASLYRSLAVLLPNERAKIWGYGFSELANEIKKNSDEKFLIDNGRIKPAYIVLAFYLKIPPEKLQKAVDQTLKTRYYFDTKWNDYYQLENFETRSIDWEEDIYKEQILVGDELAISGNQAKEHFLSQVFEIKGPTGEIVFKGYKTNPILKCREQLIKDKCKI